MSIKETNLSCKNETLKYTCAHERWKVQEAIDKKPYQMIVFITCEFQ